MRILHLLSQHPEATGSGIYLQNILFQATQCGHENYLVAGVSDDNMGVSGLSGAQCNFVRFGRDPLDYAIPGMSDVMPYPSSRFSALTTQQIERYEQAFGDALLQAIDRFRPDVIHSHHLWLATATARRVAPEIPLVASCHSTDLRQLQLCPHLAGHVVSGCRQVDRVLALSRDQARQVNAFYGIGPERIDIVGAGLDLQRFKFADKASSGPVELLCAGKLSLAKGVDWLLMTMKELHGEDIHLHLVGSGSGEEEKTCLRLAAEIDTQVTVHGRIEQRALANLMQRCHIFILPSFYEGLPLVLIEALASGCRVVSSDLPGTRELLTDIPTTLARIVELPSMQQIDRPAKSDMPGLVEKLATAIREMADEVRMEPTPSAQLCKGIVQPFDWPKVFSRVEKSYASALSGRRSN